MAQYEQAWAQYYAQQAAAGVDPNTAAANGADVGFCYRLFDSLQ